MTNSGYARRASRLAITVNLGQSRIPPDQAKVNKSSFVMRFTVVASSAAATPSLECTFLNVHNLHGVKNQEQQRFENDPWSPGGETAKIHLESLWNNMCIKGKYTRGEFRLRGFPPKGLFRQREHGSFVNSTMNERRAFGQRCQFFSWLFTCSHRERTTHHCSSSSRAFLTRLTRGRRAKTPGPLSN